MPRIDPPELDHYLRGRGPALPTLPKHPIFCEGEGCQQVARIKQDGMGWCPACYDKRQREKAGK